MKYDNSWKEGTRKALDHIRNIDNLLKRLRKQREETERTTDHFAKQLKRRHWFEFYEDDKGIGMMMAVEVKKVGSVAHVRLDEEMLGDLIDNAMQMEMEHVGVTRGTA